VTRFSRRVGQQVAPNRITRALAARRNAGGEILDLTVSNPTACGLAWPQATLARALAGVDVSTYRPEPFGAAEARAAICQELARQGVATTPERILLTSSTSEAYACLLKLLCDPGDRVAVPMPGYPLVDTLARLEGVETSPFLTRYDGEWRIDDATLRAAVRAPTRAVALVHPSNPTGAFVSSADFERVRSAGLPIVSDEVFSAFDWRGDPGRSASLIAGAGDGLVFRLDGLSKSAALPQMKLAWAIAAGPDRLVDAALARLEHIADAYLSPSVHVQSALPALLAEAPAMRERVASRCRANIETIARACAGGALTFLRPDGGWSGVVRLPATRDDEEWALAFLEKAGVFVHPGYLYDFDDGAYFVVSLLTEPTTLGVAMDRVRALVDSDRSD
jgi:aspartate/methionine/tyrosine aminotransferase